MNKKYIVTLTDEEHTQLQTLISTGTAAARTLTHARILLKAARRPDGDEATDAEIRAALDVSLATIARVRERCVEEGVEAALQRRSSERPRARKLDGTQEAHLIALHCSPPPNGQARWTLRLLADRLVELEIVDAIAPETVRLTLKKTNSSRG
jgi:transposase